MGTWALPKTKGDINRAKAGIEMLENFKTLIYLIVGDDELFDHIDMAIERIRELIPTDKKKEKQNG